jgi:hypothetical protein
MRGLLTFLLLLSASVYAAESGITAVEVPSSPVIVDSDHPFVTLNFTFYGPSITMGVTYEIYETGDRIYEEYDVFPGGTGKSFHWLALKYPNSTIPEGQIHIRATIQPADADTNLTDNSMFVNFTLQGSGITGVRSFSSVPTQPLDGDSLSFYVTIVNAGSIQISDNLTLNNSTDVLVNRNITLPPSFEQILYFENLALAGIGCEDFSAGFQGVDRILSVCPRQRMNVVVEAVPEYPLWAVVLFVLIVLGLVEFSSKG